MERVTQHGGQMWPDEKNKQEGRRPNLPRPPSEPGRDSGGPCGDRQTGMGTGEMDGPIRLSGVRKARQMVSLKKPALMREQGSATEWGNPRPTPSRQGLLQARVLPSLRLQGPPGAGSLSPRVCLRGGHCWDQ